MKISKQDILSRRLMEQEEENNDVEKSEGKVSGSFVDIVSGILHSRTQIHIYHLQTKSFAVHKDLNVTRTIRKSLGRNQRGTVRRS